MSNTKEHTVVFSKLNVLNTYVIRTKCNVAVNGTCKLISFFFNLVFMRCLVLLMRASLSNIMPSAFFWWKIIRENFDALKHQKYPFCSAFQACLEGLKKLSVFTIDFDKPETPMKITRAKQDFYLKKPTDATIILSTRRSLKTQQC